MAEYDSEKAKWRSTRIIWYHKLVILCISGGNIPGLSLNPTLRGGSWSSYMLASRLDGSVNNRGLDVVRGKGKKKKEKAAAFGTFACKGELNIYL